MEAVFGLVEDNGVWGLEDFICDFESTISRQAVHNLCIRRRGFEKLGVYLKSGEVGTAFLPFGLLTHTDPSVCVNDISIFDGLSRIVCLDDGIGRNLVCLLYGFGIELVAGRGCDDHFHTELGRGKCEGAGDVVAIADEGDFEAFQVFAMLLHSKHVGHCLAGMEPVGEGIYDGHARKLSQFDDFFVLEGTRHYAVDVAAQDPCQVPDGLAFSKAADIFGLDVDCTSVKLCHGDVEADSCSEAGLFEEHCEDFARKAQVGPADTIETFQAGTCA